MSNRLTGLVYFKAAEEYLLKDLTQIKQGESGIVTEIQGGRGLLHRLESLGIRIGVRLTKTSAQFMRGPITIRLGNSQIALGFGMAKKIILQSDNKIDL